MVDRTALADRCRSLVADGLDREGLVAFLRQAGCHKIDSIAILREVLLVDLGEAKALVHLSGTWKDRREDDDRFHEGAEAAGRLEAKSHGR